VDLRASEEQIRRWARAADDKRMTLSAWIRFVLDEATQPKKK
jgi:hypothetical protein